MGALDRAERATSSSSRLATRRWPPSWPAATRSSPARSASASRPPGPGAIHLLNGLYDAKLDHQPVVAIVGQQARAAMGGDYQQEVDLVALFKDVAHEYVHMATDAGADPPPGRPRLPDRARASARSPASSSRTTCRSWTPSRSRRTSTARCTPASATAAPRIVPARRGPAPRRGGAERGRARRDARRRGRLGAADEVHRGRRAARRRRRQGAARQGRAARRPALRHRLDRPARHASRAGT